jgi:hypothetical protein
MNFSLNKKLILLVIAGFSLATVDAQVQFGVKGGLNLANVSVSGDNSGTSYSMRPSFYVGGMVAIPAFSDFSVQPEVVYSSQGSKLSNSGQTGNYNLGYINVPVLLKYNNESGFFAETGPQLGLLLSAKASSGGSSVDIKDQLNSTDFSWVIGAGFLLPVNLGIDARYNIGLANIAKGASSGQSIKNGVIQIGVFYLFGDRPSGKK